MNEGRPGGRSRTLAVIHDTMPLRSSTSRKTTAPRIASQAVRPACDPQRPVETRND